MDKCNCPAEAMIRAGATDRFMILHEPYCIINANAPKSIPCTCMAIGRQTGLANDFDIDSECPSHGGMLSKR